MTAWRELTLGSLIDGGEALIQTGPFGSQLHAHDYVSSGVPVIPTEAIGRRLLREVPLPQVSSDTAARLARHRLQDGDILFARRGIQATGLSALVTSEHEGALCGTGAILLRLTGDALDPEFLSFWLASEDTFEWIRARAVGAVMPNLNASILRQLPLVLPPKREQARIVSLLRALDDKIELNRRMNGTLAAICAALFRSWFADFDPVMAKAEGRRAAGVPDMLHGTVPARFIESPDGPIPLGWQVGSVQDLARFVNGRNFTTGASGHGRIVIRIAELNNGPGGSTIYNDVVAPTEHVACPGDLLFSWSGSLGIYRWFRDEALINQHIFKVICDSYPQWFVHGQLDLALPFFREVAAGKATTMGHIKREHLMQARVVVPPNEVLRVASPVFQPMYDRELLNDRESLTLAALREALLPQLLSGTIRLRDAERALAAAV